MTPRCLYDTRLNERNDQSRVSCEPHSRDKCRVSDKRNRTLCRRTSSTADHRLRRGTVMAYDKSNLELDSSIGASSIPTRIDIGAYVSRRPWGLRLFRSADISE